MADYNAKNRAWEGRRTLALEAMLAALEELEAVDIDPNGRSGIPRRVIAAGVRLEQYVVYELHRARQNRQREEG